MLLLIFINDIVHSFVDHTNIGIYLYGFCWSPKDTLFYQAQTRHGHQYPEYKERVLTGLYQVYLGECVSFCLNHGL